MPLSAPQHRLDVETPSRAPGAGGGGADPRHVSPHSQGLHQSLHLLESGEKPAVKLRHFVVVLRHLKD